MFGILFRVEANPGKRKGLIDFLRWDGEFGRAHEPGTLRFEFYPDPNDENAIYVYEAYRDLEAYEAHRENEPFQLWLSLREKLETPPTTLFEGEPIWSPADSEGAQPNPEGLAMYEMLFGKKSDPSLVGLREFTINHLFANIWSRSRPPIDDERMISMRERSMITVALLAAQGRREELESHIRGARHLGMSTEQIIEIMIHVAQYAGWPAGNSGQRIALEVIRQDGELSSEPGFAQETD